MHCFLQNFSNSLNNYFKEKYLYEINKYGKTHFILIITTLKNKANFIIEILPYFSNKYYIAKLSFTFSLYKMN